VIDYIAEMLNQKLTIFTSQCVPKVRCPRCDICLNFCHSRLSAPPSTAWFYYCSQQHHCFVRLLYTSSDTTTTFNHTYIGWVFIGKTLKYCSRM